LLDSNKSLRVAMMLHELATNAVKHGALSNQSGRVSVAWELVQFETQSRVKLHWKERGGPLVVQPAQKGFGSRLIEQMLSSEPAKTRVDYDPRGVECVFELVL
jgi:two-component sensor histidine kinase